jgi:hypothetical protein
MSRTRSTDPRVRRYPLPQYDDATRVWHYHVICPVCRPKGTTTGPRKGIVNRADAITARDDFNAAVIRLNHRHRFVIQGCADPTCRLDRVED